jgi:hypothetical protein
MSGTAAERYEALRTTRDPYRLRAEKQARVTIPSLFPEMGFTSSTELYTPYQSVGARGVNNLASKLLLSLFPPNNTFFKLSVDDLTLQQMTGQQGMRAQVDKTLGQIERKVVNTLETSPLRANAFEGLKQLLVSGNVLLYMESPRVTRVFRLNQYVVKRSPDGTVLEIVIEEKIAEAALPENIRQLLAERGDNQAASTLPTDSQVKDGSAAVTHSLYTYVSLEGSMYKSFQEICGHVVPGSEASYPQEKSPYLALRWTKIDGEDYGRAYVEEYYGDLWTLECLMESLVSGATVMSKVVFFVDPASTTTSDDLAKAENGAVIEGKATDVSVLQVEKFHDLQYAKALADDVVRRLEYAFLLNTAVQRPGERVTAEEIRYMARELEDVLGGVYSVQSQEFQLPLVRRVIFSMSKTGDIPHLPKQIQPMITTGLEALGRGHDLDKLDALVGGALQTFGPQVMPYINMSDYLSRRASALGIDDDGLINTQEQVQANMQMQAASNLAPDLVKGGTTLAKTAMETHANASQAAGTAAPSGG